MAKMTVYHGGYMAVTSPKIREGRYTKDFGTGFYCTIIKEQAQRWAKRYDKGIVSIYEVRLNTSLKIKEFKEMSDEWLDFIIACRSGKEHDYDIVIGPVADDKVYRVVLLYEHGDIDKDLALKKLKTEKLCDQILFHTEKSLEYLKFIEVEELNNG